MRGSRDERDSREIRSAGGELLGVPVRLQSQELRALKQDLMSSVAGERAEAAGKLAGCAEALPALLSALGQEQVDEVRSELLYSIGSLGEIAARAEPELLTACNQRATQQAAVWAIGKVCSYSDSTAYELLRQYSGATPVVRDIIQQTLLALYDEMRHPAAHDNPELEALRRHPLPTVQHPEDRVSIPVTKSGDVLLPLGPFSRVPCTISTNALWFQEDGDSTSRYVNVFGRPVDRAHSLITHFVRSDVIEHFLLPLAEKLRSSPYRLAIYDAYRSPLLQKKICDLHADRMSHESPELTEQERLARIQEFEDAPLAGDRGTFIPQFTTGATVHLGLVKLSPLGVRLLTLLESQPLMSEEKEGVAPVTLDGLTAAHRAINREVLRRVRVADLQSEIFSQREQFETEWVGKIRNEYAKLFILRAFGTEIKLGAYPGEIGERVRTRYYEDLAQKGTLLTHEREILENRRLLTNLALSLGAAYDPRRVGVFSFRDQLWALQRGEQKALYGDVQLSAENQRFESLRRAAWYSVPPIEIQSGNED